MNSLWMTKTKTFAETSYPFSEGVDDFIIVIMKPIKTTREC